MSCRHLTADSRCGLELYAGTVSEGVCWHCREYDGPVRGLGDVVSKAAKAVGVRTCGQCQWRRESLNRALPRR